MWRQAPVACRIVGHTPCAGLRAGLVSDISESPVAAGGAYLRRPCAVERRALTRTSCLAGSMAITYNVQSKSILSASGLLRAEVPTSCVSFIPSWAAPYQPTLTVDFRHTKQYIRPASDCSWMGSFPQQVSVLQGSASVRIGGSWLGAGVEVVVESFVGLQCTTTQSQNSPIYVGTRAFVNLRYISRAEAVIEMGRAVDIWIRGCFYPDC